MVSFHCRSPGRSALHSVHLFSSNSWSSPQRYPRPLYALPKGPDRPGIGDGSRQPAAEAALAQAGLSLLATSTVSYAAMTAAGIWLSKWTGRGCVPDFLHEDWQLGPAVLWTLALLPYPFISSRLADSVEAFAEIRSLFKQFFIPQLETLPLWGIALLALGAGFGEETFFRGFLQTATISWLSELGGSSLPYQAATVTGVGAVSLVFGALHAVTPLYFYFATVSGALFGVEFLTAGLPAAAVTHSLYDFVALVYIVNEWGSKKAA